MKLWRQPSSHWCHGIDDDKDRYDGPTYIFYLARDCLLNFDLAAITLDQKTVAQVELHDILKEHRGSCCHYQSSGVLEWLAWGLHL